MFASGTIVVSALLMDTINTFQMSGCTSIHGYDLWLFANTEN